jgi:hypothetical protein
MMVISMAIADYNTSDVAQAIDLVKKIKEDRQLFIPSNERLIRVEREIDALKYRTPIVVGNAHARDGSNDTVWESEPCPPKTRIVSGTCVIWKAGPAPASLQNFGFERHSTGDLWSCAFTGPVKAARVDALCLPE